MKPFSNAVKLADCDPRKQQPFPTELLIVEGDSASRSVERLRDDSFQAVLPMQGKPLNAVKATANRVRENPWFRALIDSLGVGWDAESLETLRYDRVALLFDPDADGIHCGALVLMFLDEFVAPLLAANRVSMIKAPLFAVRASGYGDCVYAHSESHLQSIRLALEAKNIRPTVKRYRGLASMEDATLLETCLNPRSRTSHLLRREDATAARRIFGVAS